MPKKKGTGFDGRIWPNLLDFNVNIDSQLTSKANFVFGASTLVLVFILNRLMSGEFSVQSIPLVILLIGSFFASLFSIMVILPKIRFFSKKERIEEDIFYYKNILKFYSRKKYVNYLKDLPTDGRRVGKAYANQIYSLSTTILPFKFKMLKISGWVLVISIFFSVVSYMLTNIFM